MLRGEKERCLDQTILQYRQIRETSARESELELLTVRDKNTLHPRQDLRQVRQVSLVRQGVHYV